jgi:hypothetical protein
MVLGFVFGIVKFFVGLAVFAAAIYGLYTLAIWILKTRCDGEIATKDYSQLCTAEEDVMMEKCGNATYTALQCGCAEAASNDAAALADIADSPDQDTRLLKCYNYIQTFIDHAKCICTCDECNADYCNEKTTYDYYSTMCYLLFGIIT